MAVWMVSPIVIPVFSILVLISCCPNSTQRTKFCARDALKNLSIAELIESFAARPVGTLNL
jgi:hypothetical protein